MTSRTQSNRKWRLVVFVAVIAASGLVVSYCLAKMVGKVDDLSATKQVAAWDVTATLSDKEMELVTGNGKKDYPITVTNNSGVTSDCRIILSGVPSGVIVELTGGGIEEANPITKTADGSDMVFSNPSDSDVLTLGFEDIKNYVLSFSAPLSMDEIESTIIDVNVELVQKDPRV